MQLHMEIVPWYNKYKHLTPNIMNTLKEEHNYTATREDTCIDCVFSSTTEEGSVMDLYCSELKDGVNMRGHCNLYEDC